MIQFFIPLKKLPTVTHQQGSRTTRNGHHYKSAALTEVESLYRAHLAPYNPDKPITGPVRLTVKLLFPITGKHRDGEYKTTKPDTDNMVKTLKDSMTKVGFWNDDAQVASEHVEKFYASTTGIFIKVESI